MVKQPLYILVIYKVGVEIDRKYFLDKEILKNYVQDYPEHKIIIEKLS